MRFNQNVLKTMPSKIKRDAMALTAALSEYDKSLGGKLSSGECPGHAAQGKGRVCLVCAGRI